MSGKWLLSVGNLEGIEEAKRKRYRKGPVEAWFADKTTINNEHIGGYNMAGLLCLCGNGMSNSTAPSESIAEIHSPEALERDRDIELWDFWDEQWEYWHCQACQRVTVIDRKTCLYVKSYSRMTEKHPPCLDTLGDWKTLYYWSDREFYDGIEEEEKRTLGDFVQKHPPRYVIRLSPDQSKAHVFRTDTKEYRCTYVLDPPPDFLKKP